ncbi:MAG: hypothetical protein JNM78_19145 [Cyclobacteriaceae bacterium]|nr:hypothetical protein [Cyclobacteriaceae bacterium]
MSFLIHVRRSLSNIPGWRTNRKIVVFESDDWGSIRMPSVRAYESLKKLGVDMDSGDSMRFNQYDTLANQEDLVQLFETLHAHKDHHGKPVVFTAVSLVANPDFDKIRESDFTAYYYEPFTTTLTKYPNREGVFDTWKQGIQAQVFKPQFHGREHLHVSGWLKALQQGDKPTRLAFDEGMWGFTNHHPTGFQYQAAFDVLELSDLKEQGRIIEDGLRLFNELFHNRATFFVPPNGPFNNSLEPVAASQGIKFMSASKIQFEALGEGKTKRVLHYLGQRNMSNQVYITRNCFFEPSQEGRDWVSTCLQEIKSAFMWRKPAVISTHRVNYIGALIPENRTRGLAFLNSLLRKIKMQWPDAEFMTSDQLGDLINRSRNES